MLNRAAVLLRYKAPAVAWINDSDPYDRKPGITLDRVNEERTVYLIHEDDVDPPEVLSSWIEQNFLALFESGNVEENGMVVGRAALIHYAFSQLDPEFTKLVNSQVGENQGPIGSYIIKLNKYINDFHKSGEFPNAAGMKLWNITFRCMSNNSFRHYGQQIWNIASSSFDAAKDYLEEQFSEAKEMEQEQMVERCHGALGLYDYIPPQFRSS